MKTTSSNFPRFFYLFIIIAIILSFCQDVSARAGGGGGRSSSGGSHSSGGSYHSSGGSYNSSSSGGGYVGSSSSGSGGSGGSDLTFMQGLPGLLILLAFIAVPVGSIMLFKWVIKKITSRLAAPSKTGPTIVIGTLPAGLTEAKIKESFLSIQDAWQKKDLRNVRRWISDGVYQRYMAQFAMMNKLSQVNKLSNIHISQLRVAKTNTEGSYQTVDIGISFSMDDVFVSDKYPKFNESFQGDYGIEYWTYIRRTDASGRDLYSANNCPNCGAPFDTKMGEISRCVGCGTLTNNASYDWVLSEITQEDDYSPANSMSTTVVLDSLTANDDLFSVQRMEDVASNVFMQIMEVLTGASDKKLSRFAEPSLVKIIIDYKNLLGSFVFDRIYLNDVSMIDFELTDGKLALAFSITATYKRVRISDGKLQVIDKEPAAHSYSIILSKNISALDTPAKDFVYSYECPSCAAPYNDTTDDTCTYCGAPVVDLDKNWVLTAFVPR